MEVGDPRGPGEPIVDLGAVFHRAGALAHVDVEVGAERLLGEPVEVADDVDLAELGERGRPLAADPRRQGCGRVADDRADRRFGGRRGSGIHRRILASVVSQK